MPGYNHITLVGNLTKDPELKKAGESVRSSFALAVNGNYKKEDGSSPVDFINVVAWGKLAETCSEYLEKGKRVLVDGQLHIREYEKDSQKKFFTEVCADKITFLDFSSPAAAKKSPSKN